MCGAPSGRSYADRKLQNSIDEHVREHLLKQSENFKPFYQLCVTLNHDWSSKYLSLALKNRWSNPVV